MNMIVDQAMPFWFQEERMFVVKETEDWVICVVPMLFNDRITIANKNEFCRTWTAGWCYEKSFNASLAISFASVWDPSRDQRPQGSKKIAFDTRDMSYLDLDLVQYVCVWCQSDANVRNEGVPADGTPTLCAHCGSLREKGAWVKGYDTAIRLRHPTGTVKA